MALMEDRLWKKFGVEKEEYNQALSVQQFTKDPEVVMMLQEVEEKCPQELKAKIVAIFQTNPQEDEDEESVDYQGEEFALDSENEEQFYTQASGAGGPSG